MINAISKEVAESMLQDREKDVWTMVSVSSPCNCRNPECEGTKDYKQYQTSHLGLPDAIAAAVNRMAATCNNIASDLVDVRKATEQEAKLYWEDYE